MPMIKDSVQLEQLNKKTLPMENNCQESLQTMLLNLASALFISGYFKSP